MLSGENRDLMLRQDCDCLIHIIESEDNDGIARAAFHKGIHIFDVDAGCIQDIQDRRQTARRSGTSTATTSVLLTVKPLSFRV